MTDLERIDREDLRARRRELALLAVRLAAAGILAKAGAGLFVAAVLAVLAVCRAISRQEDLALEALAKLRQAHRLSRPVSEPNPPQEQ
ncbi:MAG: hypothetical protein NW241_10900 [Bacteroidia bacterium]|nr:hypothetical protein [Bacteroidia bacterium]